MKPILDPPTAQKLVVCSSEGHVAYVELNRPEKRNAFDSEMIHAITEGIAAAASDAGKIVLVLRGAGPYFCAGGDLDWMRRMGGKPWEDRLSTARLIDDLFRTVADCPLVTLAVVQGGAVGGGVGLTAACDLVIATESASFVTTETSLGIVPACITSHLVGRVGVAVARRMLLTGQRLTATEACMAGLIDFIEPDDLMEASVQKRIGQLTKGGGAAKKTVKALLSRFRPGGADLDRAHVSALAESWASSEAQAGIDQFLSGRAGSSKVVGG